MPDVSDESGVEQTHTRAVALLPLFDDWAFADGQVAIAFHSATLVVAGLVQMHGLPK